MRYLGFLLGLLALGVFLTFGSLLLRPLISEAIQSPRISLDMDPTGNTYDPATNTMTVGPIDFCLASPEANAATHTHTAHLVIENVEDLVGWQARLNYDGDAMRFDTANFAPFTDTSTNQDVSFLNLPKDPTTNAHRDIEGVTSDSAMAANSVLIGSVYFRVPTVPVSPDTPAKVPPDDASYSAPGGGVLASIDLEVLGDQSGRTLFMQLDDDNPNPPGSKVLIYTGSGLLSEDISLPEDDVASGFHVEGAEICSAVPTPTNAPTGPLTADIAMTAFEMDAPASVEADQPSNVSVAWVIQNLGPDEVEVFYRVQIWSAPLCLSFTSFVGLEVMPVLGEVRREVVVPFTCSRSVDGTLPVTFVANGYAHDQSQINRDPNPYNNARETQAKVTLLGTALLPTPTPGDPVIDDPTATPSPAAPTASPESSPASNEDPSATAPGTMLGTGSATNPTLGALAAALPSTGDSGERGYPGWAYVALFVAVAGILASAAAVAWRILLPTRR